MANGLKLTDRQNDVLTEAINLRLTVGERKIIQAKAIELHSGLSTAARYMLFKKSSSLSSADIADSERKHQLQLSAKSIAASHKKVAAEYTRVASSFTDIFQSMSAGIVTSSQMSSLTRLFLSIVDLTLEMQRDLNAYLTLLGEKDVHPYAMPRGFAKIEEALGSDSEQRLKESIRFTNLQMVVLTGKVAGEAAVLKDVGENVVSVPFDADEFAKGKKTVCRFNVICLADWLEKAGKKTGEQIVVCGFVKDDRNEATPTVKAMKIFNIKDDMQIAFLLGKIAKDAEVFKTKAGAEKMTFTLVVDDYFKGEKRTVAYEVAADKTNVMPYLKKGRGVAVVGQIHKDEESGTWLLYADNIELTSSKGL